MSENDLKPSLRFKGFTDAWEQRKLNECVNYVTSCLSISDAEKNGKYKLYDANDQIGYCSKQHISQDYITIIKDGSGVGRVRLLPKDTYFIGTMGGLVANCCDTNYIYGLLQNFNFSAHINGATIPHVYFSEYGLTNVKICGIREQQKIGEILSNLDSLITLHQHKYEKLQNAKKSLLEKMFPDETSDKPKIRFKGFTDAWEQRKFDDVVSRIGTGLNPRQNFTLNTGGKNYYVTIKNFQHGQLNLDDKCDLVDDEALKLIQNRSDLQVNDILFASIGRIGDCYLIDSEPKKWNINESVFTLRPNTNIVEPKYLFHTIHSNKVLDQILNDITGSTFKSIKVNDLKKISIPTPSKEEQKRLAEVLSNLDTLITLHQRKYEKLQNIKKSLLERMFI